MKTLILSCNTGEGHNSCAKALKEYHDLIGEECVIEDGLGFFSENVSRGISDWHVRMYRYFPNAFRYGYRYFENHPDLLTENRFESEFLNSGKERLYRYILENRFDAVICTHVFTALMVTDLQEQDDLPVKTYFVATDYTCSPGTKNSRMDAYFIPDQALSREFEGGQISPGQITGSGIPVRQMFYHNMKRSQAKRLFHIPRDHQHLVLMCGSMGCGPMEKLSKSLGASLPENVDLTIVCGSNGRLRKKLERLYIRKTNIHVRGYVKDMSALLDSADLYLTKPGGISVSEAAVKSVPMVLIDAVAGCETYNRDYFVKLGCAKTGKTIEELASLCVSILEDNETLSNMRRNYMLIETHNASQLICTQIKEQVQQRQQRAMPEKKGERLYAQQTSDR